MLKLTRSQEFIWAICYTRLKDGRFKVLLLSSYPFFANPVRTAFLAGLELSQWDQGRLPLADDLFNGPFDFGDFVGEFGEIGEMGGMGEIREIRGFGNSPLFSFFKLSFGRKPAGGFL